MTKAAIVTGGGGAAGRACAIALARAGLNVAVNFRRNSEGADQTVELCRAHGVDAFPVQGDVRSDQDCKSVVEATGAKWGRVDVLVNNAGQTRAVSHAFLDGLQVDDFADVYMTNVVGAFQMIRAVVPLMNQQGAGAIVNISSSSAQSGLGTSIAYSASKAALETMTKSLARALGPVIRVNAVAPGIMPTAWFDDLLTKEQLQGVVRDQELASPLGRTVRPEDVAATVSFLAGDGASSITGITMLVDAGVHLGTVARTLGR